MKKRNRRLFLPILVLLFILALAACQDKQNSSLGGNESDGNTTTNPSEQTQKETPRDNVTLHFFYNGYSKELVDAMKERVENKFPYIKLNVIMDGKGSSIDETLAAGTNLDLTAFSMGQLFKVMDLKLYSDLNPLIKQHGFDVNQFAPGVYETAVSYSGNGEMWVMPYELNVNVLIYNKNIFDKFGADYPVDDMTWVEAYDLARQVTRNDGDIQYKGFHLNPLNLIYKNQLGLTFVDASTLKATINTDPWKQWVETMTSYTSIEGVRPVGQLDVNFFTDQILAMRVGPSPMDILPGAVERGLDYDVVSVPKYPGQPESKGQMNAPFYTIPQSSKHVNEAFEVISYLVSDEVQGGNARKGRVPVINSDRVIEEFGSELPVLQGKNISAFFADKIDTPIVVTQYDGIARSVLNKYFTEVNNGNLDVNTALRTAQEEINKQIEEARK